MFQSHTCDAEPLVEPWPAKLEYRQSGFARTVALHSDERLNIIITPSAFRSIGDLKSFIALTQAGTVLGSGEVIPRARTAAKDLLQPPRNTVSTLYRCRDRCFI